MADRSFSIKIDMTGPQKLFNKVANIDMGPPLVKGGLLLEKQIKANASGRPGPRTGSPPVYRGTWNTRQVGKGALVGVVVGSNSPYGARLEYGFGPGGSLAKDSLGREYTTPAFPHVEPAFLSEREAIIAFVESEILKALKS